MWISQIVVILFYSFFKTFFRQIPSTMPEIQRRATRTILRSACMLVLRYDCTLANFDIVHYPKRMKNPPPPRPLSVFRPLCLLSTTNTTLISSIQWSCILSYTVFNLCVHVNSWSPCMFIYYTCNPPTPSPLLHQPAPLLHPSFHPFPPMMDSFVFLTF